MTRPKAEHWREGTGHGVLRHARVTQPPYVTLDAAMARRQLAQPGPSPMVLADVRTMPAAGRRQFDLHPAGPARRQGAGRGDRHVLGSRRGEARLRGRRGCRARHPPRRQARAAVGPADRCPRQGAEGSDGRSPSSSAATRKGVNPIGDVAALQIEGVTVIVNQARPVPQPRLLHQARRRSLDQEGRGGEVDAALPRRLRADRLRGGLCRRPRRPGAGLVAAALHEGRQGAVAVRRRPARS